MSPPYAVKFLNHYLADKQRDNPAYSLRAFARFLDWDHSHLSKIMRGKVPASLQLVRVICERCHPSPLEEKLILDSIIAHSAPELIKGSQDHELEKDTINSAQKLNLDEFSYIADVHHYAVQELITLEGYDRDHKKMAMALNLPTPEVQSILLRLIRLGTIERTSEGRYVRTNKVVSTANMDKTSEAHLAHQRQVLKRALVSLASDPVGLRPTYSATLVADPAKFVLARKKILDFILELGQFLESDDEPVGSKSVYQLSFCLFPLQLSQQHNQKKLKKSE